MQFLRFFGDLSPVLGTLFYFSFRFIHILYSIDLSKLNYYIKIIVYIIL